LFYKLVRGEKAAIIQWAYFACQSLFSIFLIFFIWYFILRFSTTKIRQANLDDDSLALL